MSRRVVWSQKASDQLISTLSYWNERNSTTTFSKKIYQEVVRTINLVASYPRLGRKTSQEDIRRIVILKCYGIFYSFDSDQIEVKLWRPLSMDPETNEFI